MYRGRYNVENSVRYVKKEREKKKTSTSSLKRRRIPRWTETRRWWADWIGSWRTSSCDDDDGGDEVYLEQVVVVAVAVDASSRSCHRRRTCRRPLRCSAMAMVPGLPAPVEAAGTPGSTRSTTTAATTARDPTDAVRTERKKERFFILEIVDIYFLLFWMIFVWQ